jgi:Rod binding domain-containing protein
MLPNDSLTIGTATQGAPAAADPAATENSKAADTANEAKLKKAGGDFESILLASMWKSMKESFKDPNSPDSDPASGTLNDWGIEVMSGAVGKAGGLGIGKMIVKYLEEHGGSAGAAEVKAGLRNANVFANSADNKE